MLSLGKTNITVGIMTNSTKPKLQDLTLSVTADELIGYLKRILEPVDKEKTHFECHFCKSNEWIIKNFPGDSERPLLVSHPIPQKNLSAWYFPVSCRECGYTMFFDGQSLTVAIDKQRSEDTTDV